MPDGPERGAHPWSRLRLPRTVGSTLVLLALGVFVPLLALQARSYQVQLRERREGELAADLEMARATAIAFHDFLHDVASDFLPIGAALTGSSALAREDALRLLSTTAGEYPGLREMSWLDPRGRVLLSSNPVVEGGDGLEPPFLARVLASGTWLVSDLTRAPPAGEPVFFVAQAVRDRERVLRGVLVATVVSTKLVTTLLPFDRVGEGARAIVDGAGRLVYRRPEVAMAWEDRDLLSRHPPGGPGLLSTALAGREATGTILSQLEGRERLAAAVPIAGVGWVAVASRPVDEALGPVRRSILLHAAAAAALVALAVAVAVALGRRIVAPLRRLEARARALGSGAPPARAEPSALREVRSLAAAFDRMEAEVSARQAALEDLLRVVSHDLRSPLGVIRGQAHLLRRQPGEPAWVTTRAAAIQVAVGRMNAMIEDLLDAARFESGQLRLSLEPLEVASFLEELLERLGAALDTQRVRLELRPPLPTVLADAGRLERIVTNLLTNALKYGPEQGEVLLTAEARGEGLALAVTDAGTGIPPEDLPHLFDRFFRGHGTAARGGLGLGLYSARVLARAHGGDIAVESGPGRGTTFRVDLPLSPPEGVAPPG